MAQDLLNIYNLNLRLARPACIVPLLGDTEARVVYSCISQRRFSDDLKLTNLIAGFSSFTPSVVQHYRVTNAKPKLCIGSAKWDVQPCYSHWKSSVCVSDLHSPNPGLSPYPPTLSILFHNVIPRIPSPNVLNTYTVVPLDSAKLRLQAGIRPLYRSEFGLQDRCGSEKRHIHAIRCCAPPRIVRIFGCRAKCRFTFQRIPWPFSISCRAGRNQASPRCEVRFSLRVEFYATPAKQ